MESRQLLRFAGTTFVVVIALVATGSLLHRASKTTPVAVDEAVLRFRAHQEARAVAAPTSTAADRPISANPGGATPPPPTLPDGTPPPATPAAASGRTDSTAQPPAPPAPAPTPTVAARTAPLAAAPQPEQPQPRAAAVQPRQGAQQPRGEPQAPAKPQARSVPDAGVYRYATTGGDSIDFGGGRHNYPAETTITVTHEGCGLRTHWEPVRERWDADEICVDERVWRLRAYDSYHEFFGHGETEKFTCDETSYMRPPDATPGTRWSVRCASGDTTVVSDVTVVGSEQMSVGGESVEVIHTRATARISGAKTGSRTSERWLLRSNGLLARAVVSTEVRSRHDLGDFTYTERYTLELRSLQPAR